MNMNTLSFRLILIFSIFIQIGCTNLFLVPSRDEFANPNQFHLTYKNGFFESQDGTQLNYWYLPAQSKKVESEKLDRQLEKQKALILQVHGNAENLTSHFRGLAWMSLENFDFMIFDYRGYGASEKEKDIKGAFEDTQAAIRKAQGLAKEKNIPLIIYGQSLGGSLTLRALSEMEKIQELKAVVIESSFSSFQRISREKLRDVWFLWPFQWLPYFFISDRYEPATHRLKRLSPVPVILIHGRQDPIVGFNHSSIIIEHLAEPKELWDHNIPGHTNAMFIEDLKYRRKLLDRLNEILKTSK